MPRFRPPLEPGGEAGAGSRRAICRCLKNAAVTTIQGIKTQIQFGEALPTLMLCGPISTLVNAPLNEQTAHAAMIHFRPETDRRASRQNRRDITTLAAPFSITFNDRE
jgi:hypothetical protein